MFFTVKRSTFIVGHKTERQSESINILVDADKENSPEREFTRYCKLKFILEQATKAQRGSRGIALLFL
jgi:hypothetical protein